jgi:1,4-dihydroxy-2-naphthoate octaprenyltransferase
VTAEPFAGRPWLMAARPHTLWTGAAPVLVGAGLAHYDGAFRWDALLVTLFAALAIQVGVNFANDVADAGKGADTDQRIGPQRAVASGLITPRAMWGGIAVAFGLAAAAGAYLIYLGGWPIFIIGVVSIIAALGYTNGPIPYGYRGLGEVFVFLFFGLAATVGTRWVFDRSAPASAWVLAIPMGLLAAAVLVANNVRDLDTDAAAGKRTLAVVLGRERTRVLYAALMIVPFLIVGAAAPLGWIPPWTAVAVAATPLAVPLVRLVTTETGGPPLIAALKGTSRLQVLVALLIAAAAALS